MKNIFQFKLSTLACIITIGLVVFSLSSFVSAQGGVTSPTGNTGSGVTNPTTTSPAPKDNGIFTLQNPLKVNSIGALLQSLMEIFTYLVIIFAVLMLIWTGFQYVVVSTQGDSKKISELHNRLMWIVIGVAVVIGARVIIEVVINTLSATGTVSPGIIDSANKAVQGR